MTSVVPLQDAVLPLQDRKILNLLVEPIAPLEVPIPSNRDQGSLYEFYESEELAGVITAVGKTLALYEKGAISTSALVIDAQPRLRQRLRDATKHLLEVIDVLDDGGPRRDIQLLKKSNQLLKDIASALNESVQHLQARSVA